MEKKRKKNREEIIFDFALAVFIIGFFDSVNAIILDSNEQVTLILLIVKILAIGEFIFKLHKFEKGEKNGKKD